MAGILPDSASAGAVVYRDQFGNALNPPDVTNAYAPPSIFVASCPLTALPNSCDARIEPRQINAIVSEMISLAECFDANGPWSCSNINNLCTAFNVWETNYTAFVNTKQSLSEKGQPNGYASLDAGGKVPAIQLPSYVDDILEYPTLADFPAIGETGKIYVAIDTGKTYRWSGTAYTEVSSAEDKVSKAGDTMSGNLKISKSIPVLTLDRTDNISGSGLVGSKSGLTRWRIILGTSETESGANAGSNFQIVSYDDAGNSLYSPLIGDRASGLMTVKADPTAALGIATKQYADTKLPLTGGTISGNLTVTGYITAQNTVTIAHPTSHSDLNLYKSASGLTTRINSYLGPAGGGALRWQLRLGDTDAETGGNAGSSCSLIRYDDAGNVLSPHAMSVSRATGLITLAGDPTAALGAATKQYVDGKYRERLTAARTYYVRTDGNDSNTGLVNNAGGAFRNISKGIAAAQSLDLSIYDVTIQVGTGTYTEAVIVDKKWTGQGKVILSGDTTTPANVTWNVSAGHNLSVDNSGDVSVKGFKFINTAANGNHIAVSNSTVTITGNCEFGAASATGNHMFISAGGYITSSSPYSITGSAVSHIACRGGKVGTYGAKTLSGTLTFTNGFVLCNYGGWIDDSGGYTGGTVTATRYSVASNAIINTYGAGANYYPGNVAGVVTTGGIYA